MAKVSVETCVINSKVSSFSLNSLLLCYYKDSNLEIKLNIFSHIIHLPWNGAHKPWLLWDLSWDLIGSHRVLVWLQQM